MAISEADANAQLAEAIHGQSVRAEAEALLNAGDLSPDARALAEDAVRACDAISAHMLAVRSEVMAGLAAQGIRSNPVEGAEDTRSLQVHLTAFRLTDPRQLGPALEVLAALGFRSAVPMTPARLAVLARTATRLRLTRFDAVSARVDLVFADHPQSPLPRALHPRQADLGFAQLPRALAFVYWALRPVRVILSRFGANVATVGENDLLGTPQSLIAPMFAALELGPQDRFVDLGSGDGRIVAAAARAGAEATGYEIDPDLVVQARAEHAGLAPKAQFIDASAERADISGASLVFLFLPHHLARNLMPGLLARAQDGCRIVVHEQMRLRWDSPANARRAIFSADAMTVLQVWDRSKSTANLGRDV